MTLIISFAHLAVIYRSRAVAPLRVGLVYPMLFRLLASVERREFWAPVEEVPPTVCRVQYMILQDNIEHSRRYELVHWWFSSQVRRM